MITQVRLKELLHYDPETGLFTWLVSRRGGAAGSKAGYKRPDGYICIGMEKLRYHAGRLAWLYVHGRWPEVEIDHINGIPGDNRIENLREATRLENSQNIRLSMKNTSGFPGVSYRKKCKFRKWRAQIRVNTKKIELGNFSTAEEAGMAYAKAKATLHPFNPATRASLPKATQAR